MKSSPIPNNIFFKEIKSLLDVKKDVFIFVQGGSMRPFLENGDRVLLKYVEIEDVKKGNIVLARTAYGIVLHRIVSVNNEKILLAGDANSKQREQTYLRDILGIVIAAYRDEKELDLYSLKRRWEASAWYMLRPFRGYLIRIYYMLKKI